MVQQAVTSVLEEGTASSFREK